MNIKTILPISEARKKIFDITKDVQHPSRHYTLTDKGKPKAVIMSAEEFESWQETLEIMHEMPDLMKDIVEAERDYQSGAYKTYATLEDILAKDGFVAADNGKKRYGISRPAQTKRTKRAR